MSEECLLHHARIRIVGGCKCELWGGDEGIQRTKRKLHLSLILHSIFRQMGHCETLCPGAMLQIPPKGMCRAGSMHAYLDVILPHRPLECHRLTNSLPCCAAEAPAGRIETNRTANRNSEPHGEEARGVRGSSTFIHPKFLCEHYT